MGFCPGARLLLRIEKTMDDDGVALSRSPPAGARGFAIDHSRSAVHGHTCGIRKDNFAAIRNFLWIDSAMPVAQPSAVPRGMLVRTFATPVNRDAREHRMLAGERLAREKQSQEDCCS